MTTQELCKRLDISHTTAIRWAKEGCPHRLTPKNAFRFDLKTVKLWRAANVQSPIPATPEQRKVRERKDLAVAERHEIVVKVMKGELIDRATTHKKIFAIIRQARDGVLGIADRVSGLCAAESDPKKCRAILNEEVERILEDLQKNVERFVA